MPRLFLVDRLLDWLLDRPAEAELRRALTRMVEWTNPGRCDCTVGDDMEDTYVCPLHEAKAVLLLKKP